jgi:hypothetical protein
LVCCKVAKLLEKSLKISKGDSKAEIRRTGNTIAKTKKGISIEK